MVGVLFTSSDVLYLRNNNLKKKKKAADFLIQTYHLLLLCQSSICYQLLDC